MIRTGRRDIRALTIIAMILAIVALLVLVVVATCAHVPGPPATSVTSPATAATAQPTAVTTTASATASLEGSARTPLALATRQPIGGGPVTVPSGALLGAWVKPVTLGQRDRISAVTDFERLIGRPLDIVNTYRRFTDAFFTRSDERFIANGATLMLSWTGGDSRGVLRGDYDQLLRTRAQIVAAMGQPMLLRYRWEMDRPKLRSVVGSAADFIAAWRHVREIFRQEGASNAAWVWCPTAEGFAQGYAADFYPGDREVDWVCVDVYAGSRLAPLDELMAPFLRWAAGRPLPIMIGEFGVARAYPAEARAGWLRDALKIIKANPQIKAACYFESNPAEHQPGQQFLLSEDEAALAAFTALAHDPYFNGP